MQPLYIQSVSCISPQPSFDCADMNFNVTVSDTNMMQCIEPDFTKYINPVQIRRMSRALKIGFAAAIQCLRQVPDIIPEAIMIGTGKGCLTDTEQFLHSIKNYHETALNATNFIHSTYNQLNGMIALNQKINSYNVTYVHRGFSFEHCLMDAALLFTEGEVESALVGSFDEMTLEHFNVKKQWGYWKQELIKSNDLLSSNTSGTISGEGAAFFMLTKQKTTSNQVTIQDLSTLFRPSVEEIEIELHRLLLANGLQLEDIDILLSGENGDLNYSSSYQSFHALLPASQKLFYKHLCGEYDTATSFACWLATSILETQTVPEILLPPNELKVERAGHLKHILLFNNYFDVNQTIILMSLKD